jgi:hypothetical protein
LHPQQQFAKQQQISNPKQHALTKKKKIIKIPIVPRLIP